MTEEIQAQGFMDIFKLADKDLIDKILALSKCVKIEHPSEGVTRIIIDFVDQK
jgi:hypothetical protein